MKIDRRSLLQAGAALALPSAAFAQEQRRFAPQQGAWRTFEITMNVAVADHQGVTQLWLPVPDLNTDFQRTLEQSVTGNHRAGRLVKEPRQGTQMFHAEFAPETTAPALQLVSRVQTRDRSIDWSAKAPVAANAAELKSALAPTEWIPLDGIVKKTALEVTRGAKTDVEKTRAIYDWVVKTAHREPKVRGCGTGDIKTMLETGNLGGKCADLNALFVGLCRASGVPARDVYGLRLVPSAFGYRELSGNPANLKGAQHCRAEVFLKDYGWVAMDPADVLKVMRQETPEWIKDVAHPLVSPVARGLFGNWEGNWVAYNTAHDLRLPGSRAKSTLPFLMYPNGENASGRFDELAPDAFKYTISAKEIV